MDLGMDSESEQNSEVEDRDPRASYWDSLTLDDVIGTVDLAMDKTSAVVKDTLHKLDGIQAEISRLSTPDAQETAREDRAKFAAMKKLEREIKERAAAAKAASNEIARQKRERKYQAQFLQVGTQVVRNKNKLKKLSRKQRIEMRENARLQQEAVIARDARRSERKGKQEKKRALIAAANAKKESTL
ncbi:hypothetical protein KIPB_001547 [Kipferlia bialata]|uniref:Uncharacterized protein n=1 Tax=Kipferlia bialata TaxID=797122 RepID=A0A9K3CP52_9EUKA|nr:hypothetical protein KIPB_001547 [Kipferlia bialata]|eukprot:g1547.t1